MHIALALPRAAEGRLKSPVPASNQTLQTRPLSLIPSLCRYFYNLRRSANPRTLSVSSSSSSSGTSDVLGKELKWAQLRKMHRGPPKRLVLGKGPGREEQEGGERDD